MFLLRSHPSEARELDILRGYAKENRDVKGVGENTRMESVVVKMWGSVVTVEEAT